MAGLVYPFTVKKALEKVREAIEANVDFPQKTTTVGFDPYRTNAAALAKAGTEAGYPAAEPNGATP